MVGPRGPEGMKADESSRKPAKVRSSAFRELVIGVCRPVAGAVRRASPGRRLRASTDE